MTKGMYIRPTAEKDAKMSDIWRDKNVPSNVKRKKGKQKQAHYHSLTKSYQATNKIDVQSKLLLGDTGRGTEQVRPRLGHKREVTCVNSRASKVKDWNIWLNENIPKNH